MNHFKLTPIGRVEKSDNNHYVIIDKEFEIGLYRLNLISHAFILWWIHEADTSDRRIAKRTIPRTRGALIPPQEMGTFSTRSPWRPNPIGLTLVKILSVEDNKIKVDYIDAFDGTPVIDIKPFLPNGDCVEDVVLPAWFEHLKSPRKNRLS